MDRIVPTDMYHFLMQLYSIQRIEIVLSRDGDGA
jgi:hypothetical protein